LIFLIFHQNISIKFLSFNILYLDKIVEKKQYGNNPYYVNVQKLIT